MPNQILSGSQNFWSHVGRKKKKNVCALYGRAKDVSLTCFEDGKALKGMLLHGNTLRFPMFDMWVSLQICA